MPGAPAPEDGPGVRLGLASGDKMDYNNPNAMRRGGTSMDKLKLVGKIFACVVGCAAGIMAAADFLTMLIDTVLGISDAAAQEEAADFEDFAD